MGFFTHVSSKIRQTFANNDKPFATIHFLESAGGSFFAAENFARALRTRRPFRFRAFCASLFCECGRIGNSGFPANAHAVKAGDASGIVYRVVLVVYALGFAIPRTQAARIALRDVYHRFE